MFYIKNTDSTLTAYMIAHLQQTANIPSWVWSYSKANKELMKTSAWDSMSHKTLVFILYPLLNVTVVLLLLVPRPLGRGSLFVIADTHLLSLNNFFSTAFVGYLGFLWPFSNSDLLVIGRTPCTSCTRCTSGTHHATFGTIFWMVLDACYFLVLIHFVALPSKPCLPNLNKSPINVDFNRL